MMRIPVVQGVIDRRILVNYRVEPGALARVLPPPFRPKLVNGWGLAGICLIRLKQIRPRFCPSWLGITSENAAHRIAVEWEKDGERREGVYIPRRDTSLRFNAFAGGRFFPGEHHLARFTVEESSDSFLISATCENRTIVSVRARLAKRFPDTSIFPSLVAASEFFERGSLGYSATHQAGRFDGLELRTHDWSVEPLDVEHVESSFFATTATFPAGSVEFDCALLMRNVAHQWRSHKPLCVAHAVKTAT